MLQLRKHSSSFIKALITLTALVALLAPFRQAHATDPITVTTTTDEMANNTTCSLREAIRVPNCPN